MGKMRITSRKLNLFSIKIDVGGEKQRKKKQKQHLSLTPPLFWGSTSLSHSWLASILALVTPSELHSNLCSNSWNILFPSFTNLGVWSNVSPIFPHFFLPGNISYPFWSIYSSRWHLLGDRAQPWPEVGGLEGDRTSCVQHGAATAVPHRGHPAAPTASARAPQPNSYLYNPWNPHPIYIYIYICI